MISGWCQVSRVLVMVGVCLDLFGLWEVLVWGVVWCGVIRCGMVWCAVVCGGVVLICSVTTNRFVGGRSEGFKSRCMCYCQLFLYSRKGINTNRF